MDPQDPTSLQPSNNPDEGLESLISQRKRLEEHRDSIRAFIGSPVHKVFVASTKRDLADVEKRIVEDEIVKIDDLLELIDFRGQRRVLKANITTFEDSVANLEARIGDMLKREQETQQKE